MSILIVQKQVQAGEYNFATDSAKGAIGSVNLGVFLPNNIVITRFYAKTLVNPTSLGAAVLSFKIGSANPGIPAVTLLTPIAFGAFVAPASQSGVDFNANPQSYNEAQIIFTIAGADLTGGRIAFVIEYDSMDV